MRVTNLCMTLCLAYKQLLIVLLYSVFCVNHLFFSAHFCTFAHLYFFVFCSLMGDCLFLAVCHDYVLCICCYMYLFGKIKTRKASCRWQTRATLAKRLHGLCKSSGVVSCIASLPIDSLPMVSYYRPIVTLCLKSTVFEIWWHIGRKSPKKTHPTLIWQMISWIVRRTER